MRQLHQNQLFQFTKFINTNVIVTRIYFVQIYFIQIKNTLYIFPEYTLVFIIKDENYQMKHLTCILTFLAYSSLHTLRMCYSFNKFNIKREFHITDFYLGVLDALIYFSLGIGTLMRYSLIRNPVHLTTIYLATTIIASLSVSIISVLGLVSEVEDITSHHHYFLFKMIITASLAVFGFMQLNSRPIVTSLLGSSMRAEQHGCLIGAWASHASAGNISGLFLSNLLVFTFGFKWQDTIFIGGIICIFIALVVYFVLQNPIQKLMRKNKKPTQQMQNKILQQLHEHSSSEFYVFIRKMLSSTQYRFYIVTFVIVKNMVYTFLLWYPIFLANENLRRYSGYITILFQLAAIMGSMVFGKLYQFQLNYYNGQRQQQKSVPNPIVINKITITKSLISMLSMTIILTLFYFYKGTILIYCLFSLGMGFFLGGTANTLGANDLIAFTKNQRKNTEYLTNFNVGLSYCFVGVIQLLVGFALYEQNEVKGLDGFTQKKVGKSQHSYKILFLILLVLGVAVSTLFAFRLFIKKQEKIQKTQYEMLEQH